MAAETWHSHANKNKREKEKQRKQPTQQEKHTVSLKEEPQKRELTSHSSDGVRKISGDTSQSWEKENLPAWSVIPDENILQNLRGVELFSAERWCHWKTYHTRNTDVLRAEEKQLHVRVWRVGNWAKDSGKCKHVGKHTHTQIPVLNNTVTSCETFNICRNKM